MSMAKGTKMLGVECPECGDLRTGVAKAGLDSEGHRIRSRKCKGCDYIFTTVEVPIPFVFNNMDVAKSDREQKRIAAKRTKYKSAPRRVNSYFVVNEIVGDSRRGNAGYGASIRFVPARKANICRRGLHPLNKANTYVRSNGSRICKACRREWGRAYRASLRERFPVIAAEDREANRLRSQAYRERKRLEALASESEAA